MNISGYKIRALRLQRKMRSGECAMHLDITTTYLSLIENGKNKPSKKVIDKAVSLFDVPPSYFLEISKEFDEVMEMSFKLNEIEKIVLSSIISKH
ncbi:helix-turn-helix domain-containing protein [Photobacterium obscurum]|uniref:helix-turn-helix domain-containing protein n=1 Tax=Photobacterium obscurum TaxID=2829490 RepID=UPI00389AA342